MNLFQKLCVALGLRDAPASARRSTSGKSNPHHKRLQDGFVSSAKMIGPRPCTLRDMHAAGGSIEIWDKSTKPAMLTGPLTLYLPAERKEVSCTVLWRQDNVVGLKFTSAFRAPTRHYG